MKVMFHVIDGVGLGHVVRLSWIERAVLNASNGTETFAVSTSQFVALYFRGSTRQVANDLRNPEHEKQVLESFEHFCPDVVVFDCRWPEHLTELLGQTGVRRILILRAFAPDRMRWFAGRALHNFDKVLLPHTLDEIAFYYRSKPSLLRLLQSAPFQMVGPVARMSSNLPDDSPVIFTIGGGGDSKADPVAGIKRIAIYVETAKLLRSAGYADLRFVAGPLLTPNLPDIAPLIPIRDLNAHHMFGPKCCVISRGGYNTCWEAIAAGSHLVVSSSQKLVEDVQARCEYLDGQKMARFSIDTSEEIARSVMLGHSLNVARGRNLVNKGIVDIVHAIVG
jgi:hypothetical protein